MIDTSHFLIAGSHLQTAKASAPAPQKTFLLEGSTDVYEVLPQHHRFPPGEGPIYPALGKKLLPAVDALEQTVGQLGKHPTPEEADRSNIRRLIRVILTLSDAYQDSYDEKKLKKATKKLKRVASAIGKYKDHGILQKKVDEMHPDGVPRKIQKRLDATLEKREAQFKEAYKQFRKEDLEYVVGVLSRPSTLDGTRSPEDIEKADRKALGNHISGLVDQVENVGLTHHDPHEFHEGRKALRWVLLASQGTRDVLPFEDRDVDAMSNLVNGLGVAQDSCIAWEWLEEEGFKPEARTMEQEYWQLHDHELAAAREFLDSGALSRIRSAGA